MSGVGTVDGRPAPRGVARWTGVRLAAREAWATAGALFVFAVVVRAIAAIAIPFPIPEDTTYYVDVARSLLQGHGLVSDALWSYQTPPLIVPRAAFEVWLPLPTFLAAVPMALLGATFRSAQVAAVAVGSLVPVLVWRLAADVAEEREMPAGRARVLAVGAGLVAALDPPLVLYGALPDSTMPFAVLALAACLLMARVLRDPRGLSAADPRLLGLGVLLGLTALTRNEALWVALAWAALAWWGLRGEGRRGRLRAIAVPAVVSIAIYVPWMVRDWAAFGTPLPGQALSNALSVRGTDIFAWADPPTLARYLAQGPAALAGVRVQALVHDLVDVLVVPGMPAAVIGLAALVLMRSVRRSAALLPIAAVSAVLYLATSLLFPVATQWGTFLHASGPIQAYLIVPAALLLDRLIERVGGFRGWTRPVAWLGPALLLAVTLPIAVLSVSTFGAQARDTQARYVALRSDLAAAGLLVPGRPIVSDHPIWVADVLATPGLALPQEPVSSVLEISRRFGAAVVVLDASSDGPAWPAAADSPVGRQCLARVPLHGSEAATLEAYRVICP